MGLTTNYLKQDVTYWSTTPLSYGGYSYAAPVTVKGRWEERAEIFRTPAGDEQASAAVVFLAADVAPGDYIFLGESTETDPTDLPTAVQVKQFTKIPDLRGLTYERKAYL
jgi:hypothetical protein